MPIFARRSWCSGLLTTRRARISPLRQRSAAAVSTPSGAPPVPMTACTPVPSDRGGDAGGKIAIADQADARARGANILDELLWRGAFENHDDQVLFVAVEAARDGANVVGDRRIQVHGALATRADDDFFHVQIGRVQQAAFFAGGQHGDGVGRAGGAEVGAFERVHGDIHGGIVKPLVLLCAAAPTFSPMNSMGASSRSPSPMTMVPSMGTWSIILRMASTAAWSDLWRSPRPMVRARGNGGLLDYAQQFQTQLDFHGRSCSESVSRGCRSRGKNHQKDSNDNQVERARESDSLGPAESWRVSPGTSDALNKGGDAGDALADDQAMNVVGALVGVDGFEVVHVAHDAVIVHDAVGAQDVARLAGGFQGHPHVVHFQHGDVRGRGAVLRPSAGRRAGPAVAPC